MISENWALSAAHCTFPVPAPGVITLQGGSSNRTSGGVVFDVEQIINHPEYDDWNLRNDVCVLRTTTTLSGENIAIIALDPVGATHAAGSRAVLSGWGLIVSDAGGASEKGVWKWQLHRVCWFSAFSGG